MAELSLGAAARLTGTSKSTLTRAVRSGRLSATRDDAGSYRIDVAELTRVYPVAQPGEPVAVAHHATPTPDPQVAVLEAELRGLRELLAEVRESRDGLARQVERLTAALPSPAPAPVLRRGVRLAFWRRAAAA